MIAASSRVTSPRYIRRWFTRTNAIIDRENRLKGGSTVVCASSGTEISNSSERKYRCFYHQTRNARRRRDGTNMRGEKKMGERGRIAFCRRTVAEWKKTNARKSSRGNVRNFSCPITTRFLRPRWRKKNFYVREPGTRWDIFICIRWYKERWRI